MSFEVKIISLDKGLPLLNDCHASESWHPDLEFISALIIN